MSIKNLPFFHRVNWNPNRSELRKFAVSMIVGFALIGLLVAWRRHELRVPAIAWAGPSLAAGALIPGLGRFVYLAVYIPTSIIGYVISRVILTIIFFLVFAPLGWMLRLAGKDLLHLRRNPKGTEWIPHAGAHDRRSFYRQF